jgi:hypothetical protein
MKKILLFILILAVYGTVSAQLRLTEQFLNPPFTTSGNLGTLNSWVQTGTGTDVQVNYRADNTGALVYPGYSSGRTSVSIARYTPGSSGTDPYKNFNATVSTNSNTVVFLSFVIRVSAAQTDYCVAFRTGAGDYLGRIFVRSTAVAPGVNFGIETNSSNNVDWTGLYSYNTTYLLVMRYDINDADNDDDVYLWVNPVLTSEPLPGTQQADVSNTGDDDNTTLSALAIRQAGNNACAAQLDAFRVAIGTGQLTTAANASAAWSNLAPQGAPLPVKLGGIKAYEKQSGIQLDWTAYSEENLSNYQVERSADGKTFEAIGSVAARNSFMETKYGWYDASPLAGVNFYRLKSIDIDSKSAYSSIVRVSLDKDSRTITIYPNPVQNGYLSFQSAGLSRGDYWIKITNAAGQQLYSSKFSHHGGAINQTIELPISIRSGMYSLQLESQEARIMSKSFIVQ